MLIYSDEEEKGANNIEYVFNKADVVDNFSRRAVAVSGAELLVVRKVNLVFLAALSVDEEEEEEEEVEEVEVVVDVEEVEEEFDAVVAVVAVSDSFSLFSFGRDRFNVFVSLLVGTVIL